MSSSKVGSNGAKAHFGCNNDRPGGADVLATSRDAEALQFAIATGNRQTKRLARKNMARVQRRPPR